MTVCAECGRHDLPDEDVHDVTASVAIVLPAGFVPAFPAGFAPAVVRTHRPAVGASSPAFPFRGSFPATTFLPQGSSGRDRWVARPRNTPIPLSGAVPQLSRCAVASSAIRGRRCPPAYSSESLGRAGRLRRRPVRPHTCTAVGCRGRATGPCCRWPQPGAPAQGSSPSHECDGLKGHPDVGTGRTRPNAS